MTKNIFAKVLIAASIVILSMHFLGHQAQAEIYLKTDPSSVAMSPEAMASMKIIGSGFKAEDRIAIFLAGADKGKDVPLAFAEADASGAFVTRMDILSILQGFFNFRFKEGKPTPDPKNPPLPPGQYTLKAKSWDSNLEAVCTLVITAPEKK